MIINTFPPAADQNIYFGRLGWSVARLIDLAKDLPVFEVDIDFINVGAKYGKMTMRDMVMHTKAIIAADLDFPIIMSEDWRIFDGRHRIMKAMLEGRKTIKAVRFQINPVNDYTRD